MRLVVVDCPTAEVDIVLLYWSRRTLALGVCTDREVEDSWSVEIETMRFASSLASSDRDGTKVELWGQKGLLV